jgi:hypothetical protein
MSAIWSLLGGKRTSHGNLISVAFDPKTTFETTVLDTSIRSEQHRSALFGGVTMDVSAWLQNFGLGQYEAACRDNENDG